MLGTEPVTGVDHDSNNPEADLVQSQLTGYPAQLIRKFLEPGYSSLITKGGSFWGRVKEAWNQPTKFNTQPILRAPVAGRCSCSHVLATSANRYGIIR